MIKKIMTWKKSNQRPVERFHCFKMWQLDLVCFEFFHCLKQFLSVSNNGASDLDIWTTVDCLFVQFIFYCSVYLFNCLGKAGADWAARVRPQSPGQSFQGSTQRNTFENLDKKKAPPPKKKWTKWVRRVARPILSWITLKSWTKLAKNSEKAGQERIR